MANDVPLRQQLVKFLASGEAHADFNKAVQGLPEELRGIVPPGAEHSPWQLLEHMRIALWDIVEFSRHENHKSPEWPKGYWPDSPVPPSSTAWEESVNQYLHLVEEMSSLVTDPGNDLFAPIPHGEGQTLLREALLVADHNAYHIGQLVLVRKMLGAWG